MSKSPVTGVRIAVTAVFISAIGVIGLVGASGVASAGRTARPVTVSLTCPSDGYQKVTGIALFDSKNNVVGTVGNLSAGRFPEHVPGPATAAQSRTISVTKAPAKVGLTGQWTCADANRPSSNAVTVSGGDLYIAFGPLMFGVNRTPPTTLACPAIDSSGRGWASMQISW